MNKTRGRSVSSSPNASRESSVHSDASSMDYAERIQAQSNSNTWAEQMDEEIFQLTPSPTPQQRREQAVLQTQSLVVETSMILMQI